LSSSIGIKLIYTITLHPTAGANSPLGIGRASANQFAQHGAQAIYLCDFHNEYLAAQQRELNSRYPDVVIHLRQFDAADEAAVKAVIQDAMAEYGRLDVMFANAGIVGQLHSFLDIDSEDFMKTMRTNVLR
jgi:NAD(P)-dependent dehydrogenase (short-subunit alcohol dehydrogenase family)